MGLREIVRELNEKGVLTTRGGKWYAGPLNIYWKILFIRGLFVIRTIKLKIRNWLWYRKSSIILNNYIENYIKIGKQ